MPTPQDLPVGKESSVAKAGGLSLEKLGMIKLPRQKDGELIHWEKPILDAWDISESAALATLDEFANTGICHNLLLQGPDRCMILERWISFMPRATYRFDLIGWQMHWTDPNMALQSSFPILNLTDGKANLLAQ